MKQIMDLIKKIGDATNNYYSINLDDDKIEYVNPIQIDNTENNEIDYVDIFEDKFSWIDNIDEDDEDDFEPHPAYVRQLKNEQVLTSFLLRDGSSKAKIDFNEDPYERELRNERTLTKFLLR